MKLQISLPYLVLAFVVALLSACGGGGGGSSAPSINSVSLSPSTATIDVGTTQQLTATAKDSGGTTITGVTFIYSSSDENVATVSNSGVVSGVAAGTATITATSGGISGSTSITINTPVATVALSPATSSIVEGKTQQLTATAADSGGTTISGATFTYSSSDTSIATVDNNGLVTAVTAGSATITATSDGVNGTATITVTKPTVAITGSAYAPGGTLAGIRRRGLFERMLAGIVPYANAQTAGLLPVAGANVLVFKINDDGTPNGGVIGQSVTNADGSFTVDVPAGTTFASDLIIQVTPTNSPQPVGPSGQNTESCPVTQADLPDITPTVEYATRTLIAQIKTNGSSLSDYTPDEVKAIIKQAITLATNTGLVGANIEDTISNIALVEAPVIKGLIDDSKSAGGATAPTGMGGTYNLVGIQADISNYTLELSQEAGTATIDTSTNSFTVDMSLDNAELQETCQATSTDRCARSFNQTSSTSSDSLSGTFTILSGNQIAFQPANTDNGGAIGSYSSNGDIVIIPTETELIVGFKQATSAPSLDGTFQAGEINPSLNGSFTVSANNPTWHTANISAGLDSLNVSGGSFTGTSNHNKMEKDITCGVSSCPDTETLVASTSADSIAGSISANSSGILTVTPPGGSGLKGAVLPSGNMFALNTGDTSTGDIGLAVGVLQGSGMTNASVSGTYRLASFEVSEGQLFDAVTTQGGTITLDGNGNGSGTFRGLESRVSSNCNSTGCTDYTSSQTGISDTPTFTYSVSSTGAVTINTGGGPTISGVVSPDGRLVVLTETMDGTINASSGNNESRRGLFVLVK